MFLQKDGITLYSERVLLIGSISRGWARAFSCHKRACFSTINIKGRKCLFILRSAREFYEVPYYSRQYIDPKVTVYYAK